MQVSGRLCAGPSCDASRVSLGRVGDQRMTVTELGKSCEDVIRATRTTKGPRCPALDVVDRLVR